MEQSILKSTKKVLNIDPDDLSFDQDILTHINSAFSHLWQLGIGPAEGFSIEDDTVEWTAFVVDDLPILSAVKTNVLLRVRMLFDPPQLQHVMTAMQTQLLESDTRLSIMRENNDWFLPTPPPVDEDEVGVIDAGDAG